MNTPKKSSGAGHTGHVSEVDSLIKIMEEIASGKYSNDIMQFTTPGHPEFIQRMAEAMGMMMVKIEARELRLEGLIQELQDLNARLKKNIIQTVITIANALGARDEYTEGHALRVAIYSERLAARMGLSWEDIETVRMGGLLHDIGKIGFSDRIFSNEDVHISNDILEEIHQHPKIGVSILKDLDFLGPVLDFVLYHHERVDGTGYPCSLKASEIPLGAMIISVADCFDAITTDRPYKKGVCQDEAFSILRNLSDRLLSPELVETFIEEVEENGMTLVTKPDECTEGDWLSVHES